MDDSLRHNKTIFLWYSFTLIKLKGETDLINPTTAFYDANLAYEENYKSGPFGLFRHAPQQKLRKGIFELFGMPIDIPFGIPSGPLLNGQFVKAAWEWGFSIPTYKTVRGNHYPCHPFPNVIKVATERADIHPGEIVVGDTDIDSLDVDKDGITNSFGVPSQTPKVWQKDVKNVLKHMSKGNTLILSFMGTKTETMSRSEYIDDFVRTFLLAKETGAPIFEVNFSCPNFGKEGLICQDLDTSSDILEAINQVKGNLPLLVKIGYFGNDQKHAADKLLSLIHHFADGVAAINTVSAQVVDGKGKQALPGSPVRLSSGICGAKIRWAGLEMAKYIVEHKKSKGWSDFTIIGVGGVTTVGDYIKYMNHGVNAVQSATGAMWKPDLAVQVRQQVLK